ncbi:MAG: class II aldolase/adducin family protein [Pseudomonadota bacterium]|nr:class II aldolase/adducin family protein [Pseudomonadota bacterium]
MDKSLNTMREVVVANRILARENVVDAYGHVSIRHPENPKRYLMSRSRSPELVALGDVIEFTLEGEAIDDSRTPYAERHIHGAIYEARPDVNAVVHNHSHAVIPFGVTPVPLKPVAHVGASIGKAVPVWDIRDNFGDTNLLVVNMEQGRDLASGLASNNVVLMRGHGCAVTGKSVQGAVMTSIYLQVNARLLQDTLTMHEDIEYLSDGEIDQCAEIFLSDFSVKRAWEYFQRRAGAESL